jgi:periplasmic protein TonB
MKQSLMLAILIMPLMALSQTEVVSHGKDTTNHVFITEHMPEFPGGVKALQEYIYKNINQPRGADGNVFVSFVVMEDGTLSDIKVVKGLNDACDKSAMEVVSKMPRWIPANADGKKVATRMVLPIKFGSRKK